RHRNQRSLAGIRANGSLANTASRRLARDARELRHRPVSPSRPIAMLLARLALQPQRRYAREELIELLWPDVELDVGRNRLRQVLSTLRRLLEPPDVPPYSVLIADRQTIALTADAISCDVVEF